MPNIFDEIEAERMPAKSGRTIFDDIEDERKSSLPAALSSPESGPIIPIQRPASTERSTIAGGPPVRMQTDLGETLKDVHEGLKTSALERIPEIEVPKDSGYMLGALGTLVNTPVGIAKFLTSPYGIMSLAAGKAAPATTSAGFAGAMGFDSLKIAKDLWQNWGNMTPAQRGSGLASLATTMVFAGLAGKHAVNTMDAPVGGDAALKLMSADQANRLSLPQGGDFKAVRPPGPSIPAPDVTTTRFAPPPAAEALGPAEADPYFDVRGLADRRRAPAVSGG